MMVFWDAAASDGPYANNLHLAPDTNSSSLTLYRPDALPGAQPCQSTEGIQKVVEVSDLTRWLILFCHVGNNLSS